MGNYTLFPLMLALAAIRFELGNVIKKIKLSLPPRGKGNVLLLCLLDLKMRLPLYGHDEDPS